MLEHIITLIAPHACLTCDATGSLLCDRCRMALPETAGSCFRCHNLTPQRSGICTQCQPLTPLSSVQAAVAYESTAKELVHKLKFGRGAEAARIMAECIARSCEVGPEWVVTHVPTATNRVRQRGYDQAQLLAKYTAHLVGAPYLPLLYRTGQTRQVGSGRAERIAHMAHVFRARPCVADISTKILLIDDVITTGSTMEAAAFALREATEQDIMAIAFAQA